jgi:hypothetical protein
MNENQSAAFIMSQTALLNCRVAGMVAENQHRTNCGLSIAYGADEFDSVEKEFEATISENAILKLYRGSST